MADARRGGFDGLLAEHHFAGGAEGAGGWAIHVKPPGGAGRRSKVWQPPALTGTLGHVRHSQRK